MILAEPCGMGNITTEHATIIYEGLKSETAFVEEVEGGVAFRQDLRIAHYDSIAKNNEYNHIAIHDSAKDYYKFDQDLHFQAEHLFHRLKRGDDPSIIDIFYSDSLRPLLDTCLPELNPDAAASLASFMKIKLPDQVLEKAGMFGWERYYTWLAKDALERDDEEALLDIYDRLLDRFDRSAQSPLFFYEAAVYLRFGDLDRAAYVNLYGLQALPPYASALPRLLKFSLQEIRIREKKGDLEGACAIGRSLRQELDTFNFAPANEEQMKDLVDYIIAFMRVQKKVHTKANLNREIKRLADLLVGHKGSPANAILKYYQALPHPEPVKDSGLKLILKSLRGYLGRKKVL
jgi:hypothetical protein